MNLRACVDKHFESSSPGSLTRKYGNIRPIVILKPFGEALYEMLFDEFPGKFEVPVPHTTRQRREKEVEGYDYFFMDCSTDEFMQQCDEGLFLEAGTFHNNFYGTKLDTVTNTMEKGKIPLLPIDAKSVKRLRAEDRDLNPIVINIDVAKPESFKLLLHWPTEKLSPHKDFLGKDRSQTEAEARKLAMNERELAGNFITDVVEGGSVENVYQKVKDIVWSGHG